MAVQLRCQHYKINIVVIIIIIIIIIIIRPIIIIKNSKMLTLNLPQLNLTQPSSIFDIADLSQPNPTHGLTQPMSMSGRDS